MLLWLCWRDVVAKLRSAFARKRTFLWFALCLVGMSIRPDLRGVTSIVRALGLKDYFYYRLLDFFHSEAVHVDTLAALWCRIILAVLPVALLPRVNGRPVFIGDGIKKAKTGRKMPAVKKLHQESANNTKPEFIYGHSCQAIALLVGCAKTFSPYRLLAAFMKGLYSQTERQKAFWTKWLTWSARWRLRRRTTWPSTRIMPVRESSTARSRMGLT